jgi:hypothetical protein
MSYWPKNTSGWHQPMLFIHIPKTAGISVQKWYRNTYGKYHKCMHGDVNHPIIKTVNETMPSWCVVRNPYSLVHSWYRYKRQMLEEKRHRDLDEIVVWRKGFDYWLQDYFTKFNYSSDKTRPGMTNEISPSKTQLDYICNHDGKIVVDHIIQLENINEQFNTINDIAGSYEELGHANKTKISIRDYRYAYTPSSRKIVEKAYKLDLEKFNYDF